MDYRHTELPEACRCPECGYTVEAHEVHCPQLGPCPRCGSPRLWRVKGNPGIAVGAYTSIEAIYGPAEAEAGETVNLRVDVKNLHTGAIYIAVSGRYNGIDTYSSPDYLNVAGGATASFTLSFPMPSNNIRVDIWSLYWTGTEWYEDDYSPVSIFLKTLEPGFRGFEVTEYAKR